MQVLVSVPPLPTPAEKRKRRAFGVLEAVVLSMLALVIPVVTLLIYRRAS